MIVTLCVPDKVYNWYANNSGSVLPHKMMVQVLIAHQLKVDELNARDYGEALTQAHGEEPV